jgi:hypothetical protein
VIERLDNEQLCALFCSPNFIRELKSRIMRWAGHGAYMGFGRGIYRVLVRRLDGKRPLGRRRCRWGAYY